MMICNHSYSLHSLDASNRMIVGFDKMNDITKISTDKHRS